MWKAPDDGGGPAPDPAPAPAPVTTSETSAPRPKPSDPREEEDPLASLPADFAAFSLTQSRPTGDGKTETFEQQRQCDAASDDPRHRRRRSFVTPDAGS